MATLNEVIDAAEVVKSLKDKKEALQAQRDNINAQRDAVVAELDQVNTALTAAKDDLKTKAAGLA